MVESTALVCSVRKCFVANTPEERVRQQVLLIVPEKCGCLLQTTAVEVSLGTLCPTLPFRPKSRRVDVVCYSGSQKEFAPLLIVECKARLPRRKDFEQIRGYNYYIRAPFFALAWPGSIALWDSQKNLYQGPLESMPFLSSP